MDYIVQKTKVTKLTIACNPQTKEEQFQKVDPVNVFIEDFGPGRGRITLECFGKAWSNAWPAMGDDRDMRTFFLQADNAYLIRKLLTSEEGLTEPDYEGLVDAAKEEIIRRRKDRELDAETARQLFDETNSLNVIDERDLDHDLMERIWATDYWFEVIPDKESSAYCYLDKIVTAVKGGFRKLDEEAGEAA